MSSFYPIPLETGASLSVYNGKPLPDGERQCRLEGLIPLLSKALYDHLVMSQSEAEN